MPANDPLDRHQSNAGPFEFGRRMKPLKHAKQLRCKGHVEAGPVVTHEVGSRFLAGRADFDTRISEFAGKLPGIADEILESNR